MKWKRSKKAQHEAKISSRDDAAAEKRGGNANARTGGGNDLQNSASGIGSPEEPRAKIDCTTPSAAAAAVQTQSHHGNTAVQLNRNNYHTINNNIRAHEQDGNCESLYRPYVS